MRRQLLIDAAIRCLGEGGMAAFTINRICQEAKVSRGLINHHFDGKDDLLTCVYDTLTAFLATSAESSLAADAVSPVERLNMLIDANFAQNAAEPSQLRAWLALWGEVSTNPGLQALHRERYGQYRANLTAAIKAIAKERGRAVEADTLALMLIALIDGLWLECSLDPEILSPRQAKAACHSLLEPHLGAMSLPNETETS